MANNQYVNKVIYNGTTLIDTSIVTVTADNLLKGYTALNASGALITGTAESEKPSSVSLVEGESLDVIVPNESGSTDTYRFYVDENGHVIISVNGIGTPIEYGGQYTFV